jgi:putative FmdB family regulatory protein
MPLYDCKCPGCGTKNEQLLKREEEPDRCPQCGKPMKREVAQLASFALKGGGWYKDGYSKGSGGE